MDSKHFGFPVCKAPLYHYLKAIFIQASHLQVKLQVKHRVNLYTGRYLWSEGVADLYSESLIPWIKDAIVHFNINHNDIKLANK